MGALYGHAVESDLPLSRLREGPGNRGTLEIRRAELPAARDTKDALVRIDDEFAVHREGGRLVMWCRATGTFVLDAAARRILADPTEPPGPWWEHRLASVAVPLLLAEAGDLALHASVVGAKGRAVAFVAPSGRGKSTTAWALGAGRAEVLADDGAIVTTGQRILVWPGPVGVRLRDPEGGKRSRMTVAGGSAAAVPLAAVVLLGERTGTEARLWRLDAADALLALMPNAVHAQGRSLEAAFRGAAELVRRVPCFGGTLPDDLAGVSACAGELLQRVLDASPDSAP